MYIIQLVGMVLCVGKEFYVIQILELFYVEIIIFPVIFGGQTPSSTFKESANSTGYDVVLGKGSKKEHGETRPYQYGTYKKLNVKPGVCKAVFKNVPAGTYYAGVHSWNRTASENDNKVFSKWSNLETAKVK